MDPDAARLLGFWFEELEPKQWFKADAALDDEIRWRFGTFHERLAVAVPASWLETPEGCLAAVIALDQLPRNMFRGTARAFATDAAALAVAQHAIGRGFDKRLDGNRRKVLYMPFQHSEDRTVQARSMELFAALDNPETLVFARRHREIVDRFGRFPHRNAALGRTSTDEEFKFLDGPDSSF